MSTPPVNYQGIIRVDTKQTDLTVGQYNGQARPGEIIVDLTTYDAWIGLLDGSVVPFNNPSLFTANNISNGTSNVRAVPINGNITTSINGVSNTVVFSDTDFTFAGDLLPPTTSTYSIGNATLQVKDVWLSGFTAYVGNVPISEISGNLAVNGAPLVTTTSTGNLDMVDVTTGNITGGNLVVTGDSSFSGNLNTTGYISTSGDFTSVDTITGGNLATTGTITALDDIDTTANVNVTGDAFAASVVVSGNINGNEFTATTDVVTDIITSITGPITLTSVGVNSDIILDPSGIANVNCNDALITNLNYPINPQDLATKTYADSFSVGLETKDAARCATTISLAAVTGDTVTYNNGVAGVGATLNMASALTTIDGVILVPGDRILIKNEPTAAHNGIYVYTDPNTLTRATDSDTPPELAAGSFIFSVSGAVNGKRGFTITREPTVIGTDPILFTQISSAATLGAINGISLSGSTFSVALSPVTPGTYTATSNVVRPTINNSGIVTAVSTNTPIGPLPTLQVTSNLTVSNISTTSNLQVAGNVNTTGLVTSGSVYTGGSLNIGSNLTVTANLVVSGNANLDIRSNSATSNVISFNNIIHTTGNIVNVRSRLDVVALGNVTSNLANGMHLTNANIGPITNFRIASNAAVAGNFLVTTGNGSFIWGQPQVTGTNVTVNETFDISDRPIVVGSIRFSDPNVANPLFWNAGSTNNGQLAYPIGTSQVGTELANRDASLVTLDLVKFGYGLTYNSLPANQNGVQIPASGYMYTKLNRSEMRVRDRPMLFEVEMRSTAIANYGAVYMSWDTRLGTYAGLSPTAYDYTPSQAWNTACFSANCQSRVNGPAIQLSSDVSNTGNIQLSLFTIQPQSSFFSPQPNWEISPTKSVKYNTSIPRRVLTNGKRFKMSWLYYWPSTTSDVWMWLFLNNRLYYTSRSNITYNGWVENAGSDVTQNWGNYMTPMAGASSMNSSSASIASDNVIQVITRFYLGNGEEFMYRHGLQNTWQTNMMNMSS